MTGRKRIIIYLNQEDYATLQFLARARRKRTRLIALEIVQDTLRYYRDEVGVGATTTTPTQ